MRVAGFKKLAAARAVATVAAASAGPLIGATGGITSAYSPFGLVAVLAAGVGLGIVPGVIAGTLVALCAAPSIDPNASFVFASGVQVATWMVLFPIVGFAGGFGARLVGSGPRDAAVDKERRRIARELHDGVAQALAHLRYELDFLSQESRRDDPYWQDIARLAHVADRALADLRGAVHGLRVERPEGLAASLRAYLSEMQGHAGAVIEFSARGEIALPEDVQAEIFRVAQEAVSNAMRHAQAGLIRVTLHGTDGTVRLTVDDDGVGMSLPRPVRAGHGVGMSAMRERAEEIGATLSIGPRPNGGTRVSLVVGEQERRLA